jgi:EIX receptor 1/2
MLEKIVSGKIPAWIGTMQSYLIILHLSSNLFTGRIPSQLCYLKYLQILDLSHDNIAGAIPPCLNNLIAMAQTISESSYVDFANQYDSPLKSATYYTSYYINNLPVTFREKNFQYNIPFDDTQLTMKGWSYEYNSEFILGLMKFIDLSSNKLK